MDENQLLLIKLAHTKMPFGKYEEILIDLPEYYVVWYYNKGFPKGQLGEQLKLIYVKTERTRRFRNIKNIQTSLK
jgi:uncharacterized protein (DUF3820 family)